MVLVHSCPRAVALYCLLTQAGHSLHRKLRFPALCALLSASQTESSLMVQEKQMPAFAAACYILNSGSPRWRALLPAHAGGTLVNGPRKTNATFGVACFSFGLIISYTHESRADALHCLLTQAIRSLMACEKQMSAAQPLVFPCAHYIIVSSFRLSVFPWKFLKYFLLC